MRRRPWILIVFICCGCGKPAAINPESLLPAEVEGGWRRGPVTEQAPGEAPKLARELGMDRVFAASYSGPGEIDATLFRMRTPEVAFELAQNWSPSPDSVSTYEKCDFVTVRWRAAEREVGRNFVRALARPIAKAVRLVPTRTAEVYGRTPDIAAGRRA